MCQRGRARRFCFLWREKREHQGEGISGDGKRQASPIGACSGAFERNMSRFECVECVALKTRRHRRPLPCAHSRLPSRVECVALNTKRDRRHRRPLPCAHSRLPSRVECVALNTKRDRRHGQPLPTLRKRERALEPRTRARRGHVRAQAHVRACNRKHEKGRQVKDMSRAVALRHWYQQFAGKCVRACVHASQGEGETDMKR